MELHVEPRAFRLRTPLETAWGTLERRELLLVGIRDDDGLVGWGEAAPLEPYDGVPLALVREALEAYRPVLAAGQGMAPGDRLDALREAADLPQALAGLDLALWDLRGRREGRPVAALLASEPAGEVEVNATIRALDRAGAAAEAAAGGPLGLSLPEGQGGHGRRRGADRRRAGRRGTGGRRCGWTQTGRGTPREAVTAIGVAGGRRARARRGAVPRRGRAARGARAGRRRGSRWTRPPRSPARCSPGAADAVCLKISRCGGISALLGAGRRGPRDRRRGLPGLELRRAARASPPRCTRRRPCRPLPPCGLATLGRSSRVSRIRCPRARPDRRAHRAGARRRPAAQLTSRSFPVSTS